LSEWLMQDYGNKFDETGNQQLKLLSARVRHMHDLIDGILQYSRVGRVREEKVRVDLDELVPEIIDVLAPPENIHICIENKLPVVEFEKTRITQVFQNLLSNAVKYMDKTEGEIKIGCRLDEGFYTFSIADNGAGIERRNFDGIFGLFKTLKPHDDFESTGVGLSLVKKIVELYNGQVWVESEVGKGSTFYFTMPEKAETDNGETEKTKANSQGLHTA